MFNSYLAYSDGDFHCFDGRSFDSTKAALPDVIRDILAGKVQLPDFQRGWVWDAAHVRSLLVSIAPSFPVGAVVLLETGGVVRFQMRPVENLELDGKIPEPEKLILDDRPVEGDDLRQGGQALLPARAAAERLIRAAAG